MFYKKAGIYIYRKKDMIYLRNSTESQVMYIPKNGDVAEGDLVFSARNTIDLETEVSLPVTDLGLSSLYFNLAVSLPADLPDGEYEYNLTIGDVPVSTGLLVIGEDSTTSQYNKDITYEQYESE